MNGPSHYKFTSVPDKESTNSTQMGSSPLCHSSIASKPEAGTSGSHCVPKSGYRARQHRPLEVMADTAIKWGGGGKVGSGWRVKRYR